MMFRYAWFFLAALLIGIAAGPAAQTAPLTDEDVVRLFVRGMPADELIRHIDSSDVDFDLSDEMLEELRIAGIPEVILDAMIGRQAAMHPVPTAAEITVESGASRLVVRLNPAWEPKKDAPLPRLRTLDAVDARLSESLGLRTGDLTIADLGIALLCRTADHVPDHWRSQSPLGRDFNAPRHRMLVFVSGATAEPAGKFRNMLSKLAKVPGEWDSMPDLQMLTLEVPERLAVELDPGVAHDLTLGITIRVGERNYLTLADEFDGVVLAEAGDTTLLADLRAGGKNPLKARVEFRRDEGG